MPASIAELLGKPMMAYVGETPWHRLGFKQDVMNVREAIKAASLDFNVELRPLYTQKADGSFEPVATRRAVVRDVDGRILATVGSSYHPIQPLEAFSVLDEAVKEFGLKIETAGALGRGERIWMLAKMPQAVEVVPGDKLEAYVYIVNNYDGFRQHEARFTTVRVVCANTDGAACREAKPFFKIAHRKGAVDRLKEMQSMVTGFVAALKETGDTFRKLAAHRMTAKDINAYIDAVLDIKEGDVLATAAERRRDRIRELATGAAKGSEFAPKSAWAAFNAVTEYVDHNRDGVYMPNRLKSADTSALFGVKAAMKARALKLAMAA